MVGYIPARSRQIKARNRVNAALKNWREIVINPLRRVADFETEEI